LHIKDIAVLYLIKNFFWSRLS